MTGTYITEDRRVPVVQHRAPDDCRFEAMLWLRKGFGFSGEWTVNDQNDLLVCLFGLQKVNKA